jgi:hypothetical protein
VADFELALAPGHTIAGGLQMSDNKPIAAARIDIRSGWSVSSPRREPLVQTTSADGRFRFDGLFPGMAVIRVTGSAIAPETFVRMITADVGFIDTDITIRPEAVVIGSVLADDGRPAENAIVTVAANDILGGARTDASGRFRIGEHPAEGVKVWAEHATLGRAQVALLRLFAGKLHAASLRIQHASVSGRVIDSTGAPLAGIALTIRCSDDPSTPILVTADERGRYRLGPISPGLTHVFGRKTQTMLDIVRDGDAAMTRVTLQPNEAKTNVDLTLGPDVPAIQGILLDVDGRPLGGVMVGTTPMKRADGFQAAVPPEWSRVVTRTDGTFTLSSLARMPYTVWAHAPGMPPVRQHAVLPGAVGLRLQLQAGATVSGRVVDDTQRPISDFTVRLTHPGAPGDEVGSESWRRNGGASHWLNISRETGVFELGGLAEGTWSVTVSALDGRRGQVRELVLRPGEHRRDVIVTVGPPATEKP